MGWVDIGVHLWRNNLNGIEHIPGVLNAIQFVFRKIATGSRYKFQTSIKIDSYNFLMVGLNIEGVRLN